MLVLRKCELAVRGHRLPDPCWSDVVVEPGLAFAQAQVNPSDITKFINNNWGRRHAGFA